MSGGGLVGAGKQVKEKGRQLLVDNASWLLLWRCSSKPTSGATETQKDKKMEDSKAFFTSDILKDGATKTSVHRRVVWFHCHGVEGRY